MFVSPIFACICGLRHGVRRPSLFAQECMGGVNATVLAYGQHGSGKSYALAGAPGSPGLAQLSAQAMFHEISQRPEREFLLRVSMCEVAASEGGGDDSSAPLSAVHDLLRTSAQASHGGTSGGGGDAGQQTLEIREDPHRGTIVHNLTEVIVTSPAQVRRRLCRPPSSRTSATEMLTANATGRVPTHSLARSLARLPTTTLTHSPP